MYFVDQEKIRRTLIFMTDILDTLKNHSYKSKIDYLALERMAHVFIEGTLDVGNMMIDGFIMRDPGSYEDIIDILVDEKVIPVEEEEAYKALILWRKPLVHDYQTIDHKSLEKFFKDNLNIFTHFSERIDKYLQNELGVANAFSNK
ncbi:DUF86 domain-containing protein [Oceanobacillus neutriphilus]|uniref:DUF86 domain-containing protein n=1 Tax=Oceanobacillus neutriphilus TaxID=531815 RepID=A0ABQ2NYS4_9BACI|nr:DUF86 domain-containing protein [Oceanobacillus neutriphilus]GGP13922.1 hypothetical protein GCM10011346_35840 [Oceanobacillus neutriphilus]